MLSVTSFLFRELETGPSCDLGCWTDALLLVALFQQKICFTSLSNPIDATILLRFTLVVSLPLDKSYCMWTLLTQGFWWMWIRAGRETGWSSSPWGWSPLFIHKKSRICWQWCKSLQVLFHLNLISQISDYRSGVSLLPKTRRPRLSSLPCCWHPVRPWASHFISVGLTHGESVLLVGSINMSLVWWVDVEWVKDHH